MAGLYLFYQGQQRSPDDGRLWWQAFDGTWHGVQEIYLGGDKNMSYAPAPVVFKNIIHVLHQGAYENGQLWLTWYDANVWNPDVQVPGVGLSWSPSAVVFNNQLYVFHPGSGESGELWYIVADATTWSDDMKLISGGDSFNVENGISLSPSAVVWNNMLYVFFQNGHGGGGLVIRETEDFSSSVLPMAQTGGVLTTPNSQIHSFRT